MFVCACVCVHSRVSMRVNVCVSLSSLACMCVYNVFACACFVCSSDSSEEEDARHTSSFMLHRRVSVAGSRQECSWRPVLVSRRVGSVQSFFFLFNSLLVQKCKP
jgi:hypothetical protein